jgi:hypothetical protein
MGLRMFINDDYLNWVKIFSQDPMLH